MGRIQRIYAREIVYEGVVYRDHVIELNQDTLQVRLFPFERELHSTTYYNGRIEVSIRESRLTVNSTTAVRRP